MANQLVQDLIEAGIHFGQRSSGWNPKMQPYIYGKRNGIHIIDIKETIKGLLIAKKFVTKLVMEGKDVCFVGTKRQAKNVIETRVPAVKQHFVTERWLGGTLTNFRTIRLRLKRLDELDSIEQNDNYASYSKKMESQLRREQRKIKRNLEGIRHMDKLPGALIIVDVRAEITALKEARKLGIPTICLIDTDGDPEFADIPIPGNDDSMRSIDVVVRELCIAIAEAQQAKSLLSPQGRRGDDSHGGDAPPAPTPGGNPSDRQDRPRRSTRAQFKADGTGEPEPAASGS
jgi:small subunit ribosomal protein S2